VRAPMIEHRPLLGESRRIEVERANSYQLELDNLARATRGEEPALLGREDALGQARAVEALYRAAESGETVKF